MSRPGESMEGYRSLRVFLNLHNLLLALLAGAVIGGCGFLVDHLVHQANRLRASDVYTCVIAIAFSYVLLALESGRRAALARRMEIAAEVNHHIRNALTGVVFTAAVRNDPALEAVVTDATERIDWVLNTVLPDGSKDLAWPIQAPLWHPKHWKRSDTKKEATEPAASQ